MNNVVNEYHKLLLYYNFYFYRLKNKNLNKNLQNQIFQNYHFPKACHYRYRECYSVTVTKQKENEKKESQITNKLEISYS